MQEEREKHRLAMQAMQIEEVFVRRQVPARVGGGQVAARRTSFELQTSLALGWERIRALKDELVAALRVKGLDIYRADGRLRVDIVQESAPPVPLLELLPMLPAVPPVTAVLGWAEEERPVLLNLPNREVGHLFIAGGPEAGKSSLLRTIGMSLALLNRQAAVQLVAIEPDYGGGPTGHLQALNHVPHMLAPVSHSIRDAAELLAFLDEEMGYRLEQGGVTAPAIVLLVDRLAALLASGGEPVRRPLLRLLQRGPEAGLHVVMATSQPEVGVLDGVRKLHLPVRVLGWLESVAAARAASGLANSQADYLLAEGDFLAIVRGESARFQAAFIGDYDLHLALLQLNARTGPVLLAQPTPARPQLPVAEAPARLFTVGDAGVTMDQPSAAERVERTAPERNRPRPLFEGGV